MLYNPRYIHTIGFVSIMAGLLALACILTGIIAVEYNFDAFSNPVLTLQYSHNHELARWFNLFDMFGYYLLLLPLVFYFHSIYKFSTPWMPLITFSGCAYVLIGALGAAILSALWPEFMTEYLSAPEDAKPLIASMFKTTTLIVTKGMWNILEVLFAAVWWIGVGRLLITSERFILSVLSILTGLATLIDASGNIFGFSQVAEVGLSVYLVMGILWPIAVGASLWGKPISNKKWDKEEN